MISLENKIFPIISGILIAGISVFILFFTPKTDLVSDKLSADIQEEKLLLLGENTLIGVSSPSEPEPKVVSKLPVVVTAYSSTVWETDNDPYITAAGTWVREGIIANNLLPFGTKVRLPEIYGEKVFIVEDRMSWKKGYYHVDIWFGKPKNSAPKTLTLKCWKVKLCEVRPRSK
jgi:hypothetical protein